MVSLEQARKLIKLARDSISAGLSGRDPRISRPVKQEFSENMGAFVTLKIDKNLRGCIGFTEPAYPLYTAIIKAAKGAAFHDPRFPKLSREELANVCIEVSVLTKPTRIEVRNPEEYFKKIHPGKDGLLVIGTFSSGLLLPQVATEYRWDAKTFLQQTCVKAGLKPDTYYDYDNCRVYKFQSEVFSEKSPEGEVVQIM